MREDGDSTRFVDRCDGLGEIEVGGDWLRHPQRQDVAVHAADFYAWNDLKRIKMLVLKGVEARIQCIMVGDCDGIQPRTLPCDKIQQGFHARFAVAGVGVHVQVGASEGLMLAHGVGLIMQGDSSNGFKIRRECKEMVMNRCIVERLPLTKAFAAGMICCTEL